MKRIESIDFLKGIFLILMTVDHLILFSFESLNFIYDYSFQPLGFVASTEGFIFLSGLIVGVIYGRKILLDKSRLKVELLRRIFRLYRYHLMSLGALFVLFSIPIFRSNWDIQVSNQLDLWLESPLQAFFLSAVLLYQSPFTDILPLYIGFLVFAIFALIFFKRGYFKSVLFVSMVLWGVAQFYPQKNFGESLGLHLGWFEFFAWQFLFVIGIALGFKVKLGVQFPIKKPLVIMSSILSITFLFLRYYDPFLGDRLWFNLLDIRTLGIMRLINFACLAYLVFFLIQKYNYFFRFEPVQILGRYSLQVFSFHVVLLYFLGPLKAWLSDQYLWIQLSLLIIATLSIYLPVFIQNFRKN